MQESAFIAVIAVVWAWEDSDDRLSGFEAIVEGLMTADDGGETIFAAELVGSILWKFDILSH